jgi:hypothetical protein
MSESVIGKWGIQYRVPSALLGTYVHLYTIFLINEGDGDILRFGYLAGGGEDSFPFVPEDDMADIDLLGSYWVLRGSVFTGPHCKESDYCEGGCDCSGCVLGGTRAGTTDKVEDPKELRSHSLLMFGRWVKVLECLQEQLLS